MAISIPFPLPASGYALNSKMRVNFDFIVDQFNKFNTGVATWDTVDIGIANSVDGVIKLYHNDGNTYTMLTPGARYLNITYSAGPAFSLGLGTSWIDIVDNGTDQEYMQFGLGRAGSFFTLYNTVAAGTIAKFNYPIQISRAGGTDVTIQGSATAGTGYTLTLPINDGNSGQMLTTDGSGVLSWTTPTAGANTALSNLVSVAINTSLISDTHATDDLGSSAKMWLNVYGIGYQVGKSGTNGWIDLFPPTAASGSIELYASNNAGDHLINITNASQAGARTYTIPDAGASAAFAMNPSAVPLVVPLGTAAAPSFTFTGGTNTGVYADNVGQVSVSLSGAQEYTFTSIGFLTVNNKPLGTVSSPWGNLFVAAGNFSDTVTLAAGKNIILTDDTTNTCTIALPAAVTSYTLTLPANDGAANQVLTTDGSGVTSWADAASGGVVYREDYVVGTALNNYSGSTTVFDLNATYVTGDSSMLVSVDGVLQTIGATVDYVETDTNTVTFNNALVAGQKVAFVWSVPTSGTDYATKALDNLGSVAINTSLISDTNNTDDLGSSAKKWKDLYLAGNAYLPATGRMYLDGGGDTYIYEQAANTIRINAGNNVGIQVNSDGSVNQINQPSFLLTKADTASNVTGDATAYTVIWNGERYDQGGDVADLGGGTYSTFTAPVAGRYLLTTSVLLNDLTTAHLRRYVSIVTSNLTYTKKEICTPAAASSHAIHISVIADMDANDTAYVNAEVDDGTKVVDVGANASYNSFSGSLIN